MSENNEKELTPVERADNLAALELVISDVLPRFVRASVSAYVANGSEVFLPQAERYLAEIREAIRLYDAREPQVFQLPVKAELIAVEPVPGASEEDVAGELKEFRPEGGR